MLNPIATGLSPALLMLKQPQLKPMSLITRFFSPSFPSLAPRIAIAPHSKQRHVLFALPTAPRFFSRHPVGQGPNPRVGLGATTAVSPSPSPSPILAGLGRRAFSTSRAGWVRQTYFPKQGKGSGGAGGGGGMGWFKQFKRRFDAWPPMFLVWGLIGTNIAVFLLWQYAQASYERFRDPTLYHWLWRNFIMSEANIAAGRIWTLITASFSHSGGQHIFFNCLGLYFTAPAVISLIGSSAFMGLYLAGGVAASLVSLAWNRRHKKNWAGSEGASGAIYACLGFYAVLFPRQTFLLYFVVPMPAWVLIGGIFAWDAYRAVFAPSTTDSAGHVGGLAAGLAAAMYVRKRIGRFGRGRW